MNKNSNLKLNSSPLKGEDRGGGDQVQRNNKGTVVAVNISKDKGTRKQNIGRCILLREHGLRGDAHAGQWHRQVSLLAQESINKMQAHLPGFELKPGDFAENITTKGMKLSSLPVGTRLEIGDSVLLEVTQIGKACYLTCEIRKIVGDCIMPREGIFARVLEEGEVKIGDTIRKIEYQKSGAE